MNWLRDEASTDEEASSKLSSKESTENNLADEIPKNDHLIVNPSPSHEQLLNILRENNIPAAWKMNERIDDSDGFIGVKRKRNRIKKFFLSGIAENVNDQDILCYLEKRKVIPTYLSLFKSKRKGSISAKLHVQANVCPLIENETFWPKFVKCKPWKPTSTDGRNNSPPEGILSTYV